MKNLWNSGKFDTNIVLLLRVSLSLNLKRTKMIMSKVNSVSAIKNRNSQVIFVLIEESSDSKMKIINPEGKILTVPGGLFETPYAVSLTEVQSIFTPKQVATIEKTFSKGRSRSSTTKKKKAKKSALKFGVGAEWSSSKLTFYKHKIDPLSETQSFKIVIEKVGIFVITKLDFCKLFNEVIISTSYWEEGSFTFSDLPEKARKFIKAA